MTRPGLLDRLTFGGRVASAVTLLIAVTALTSLAGAFGTRHGLPLHELLALEPTLVWRGELWRLVTWSFVEVHPLNLLFAGFMIWFFGNDLAEVWSNARLVQAYAGLAVVAAVETCLLALVDPAIHAQAYLGAWPICAAMAVAWGLYFPDRTVRFFFLFSLRGIVVAWLTGGLVLAFAIYYGWEGYLPALTALATLLAWVFRGRVVRRVREAAAERRAEAQRKQAATQREATLAAERDLDAIADDDHPPPIPPDVDRVLGRILDEVGQEQRAKRQRSR